MAEKTDLNISPYHDDYSESKNFHKVLYRAGRPLQAREHSNTTCLSGDSMRLQIKFQKVGTKWLISSYANLELV
jgi:hypothetical protein